MKIRNLSSILTVSFLLTIFMAGCSYASSSDQILLRWSKSQRFESDMDGNVTVTATYYSAEYIEAYIQKEAQKNLWTQNETEEYKYNFLGALQLEDKIPVLIEFENNGPTMYLGPFDAMVKLTIGKNTYKPIDYDRRFNFKFQGKKEGLVYFPRYDEKTGKDLLKGIKTIRLVINSGVSSITVGRSDINFLWDVVNDDPSKLYQGKTAARFETDRLLKRLEKLRKDKAEHEKQLQGINDEISTVQKRLDELAKQ